MAGKTIAIAGGGIGGMTAALAFAKLGHDVTVYEQAQELGEVGAGIQLSPNAMQVFQSLGLNRHIEALSFEPEFGAMRGRVPWRGVAR